jgi:hypothetical protein
MTSRSMTFSKSILLLISLSMIAALVACSGSNSPSTTIQPPPSISVAISTPLQNLAVTATASLSATVLNDSANAGVTWTVTCGSTGACGSFNPTSTLSGVNTTYTAPSAIPTGNTVVITATSVTDTTKSANITVTITATPALAVTLTTPPPSSLVPSGTASVVATVTNDPLNGGVTYSCAPAGTCGTFSSGTSTVASGATVTYTAPSTTGNVTITATSVDSTTTSASANVNITTAASGALTGGNYTFWLSGWDSNNSPYYVAGAITLVPGVSGTSGTITGEQDFVDASVGPLGADSLAGSSYAITSDGNLQITLTTNDANIGPGGNGIETLNATLTSGSSARIIEFDIWASGSGQLEPQSIPATTPLGGYAFSVGGYDNIGDPLGIGGVINVDATSGNNISVSGSIFDENDAGTLTLNQTFFPSSVSPTPDGSGRVTFTLLPSSSASPFALVGYFVDSTHVRLVETLDNLGGTTGGQAFVQTGTGTFNTSSFEGSSYVFGATGFDNTMDAYFLQMAGVVTGNSDGTTVSGNISFNDLENMSAAGGNAISAGTYTVDDATSGTPDAGTGRVTLSGLTVGSPFPYNLELYLDGNGNARVLSLDANDMVDGVAGLQNLTGTPFNGTFALGATGYDFTYEDELDAVGQVAADTNAGTFSGFADLNWLFDPTPGPTFGAPTPPLVSGAFAAASTAGVYTGTVTGIDVTYCQLYNASTTIGCTNDVFNFYVVNPSTTVGIETDDNQLTLIRLEFQQ